MSEISAYSKEHALNIICKLLDIFRMTGDISRDCCASKIAIALDYDVVILQDALFSWFRSTHAHSKLDLGHVLPPKAGDYNWIRTDNDPMSRMDRLGSAFASLVRGARFVDEKWLARTRLVFANSDLKQHTRSPKPKVNFSANTVFDEAVVRACNSSGTRVVVVNAASAYHVGGGFLTGGRHALEEAACMQSTLFFSLQRAKRLAKNNSLDDSHGYCTHIPEDGVIVSPDVDIFRQGSATGYQDMHGQITRLAAVLSVAMPNRNHNVHGTPVDHRAGHEYEDLLERKWHAVLQGAALVKAHVLIIPDAGCGVFRNDPKSVGYALGKVVCNFSDTTFEIVLTGNTDFYNAVKVAMSDVMACSLRVWNSHVSVRTISSKPGNNLCFLEPRMPQVWKIVGGSESGGILVREGAELKSPQLALRLATGAEVEEIAIVGDRLHFRKCSGTGPDEGWVSIRTKEKDLALRIPKDDMGSISEVGRVPGERPRWIEGSATQMESVRDDIAMMPKEKEVPAPLESDKHPKEFQECTSGFFDFEDLDEQERTAKEEPRDLVEGSSISKSSDHPVLLESMNSSDATVTLESAIDGAEEVVVFESESCNLEEKTEEGSRRLPSGEHGFQLALREKTGSGSCHDQFRHLVQLNLKETKLLSSYRTLGWNEVESLMVISMPFGSTMLKDMEQKCYAPAREWKSDCEDLLRDQKSYAKSLKKTSIVPITEQSVCLLSMERTDQFHGLIAIPTVGAGNDRSCLLPYSSEELLVAGMEQGIGRCALLRFQFPFIGECV